MNRLAVATMLVTGLSGCATDGKLIQLNTINNCPGDRTGVSYTPVTYGDSHLAAFNLTEIAQGSEWLFQLAPLGSAYDNSLVTIEAKAGGPAWLSVSGERSGGRFLQICVPDTVPVGQTYEYEVTVQGVGVLDPRARVVPR